MGNTLRPIHNSFQTIGASSTYSSSYSPYDNSMKGFRDFDSFDGDSTYTNSRVSGFEYFFTLIGLVKVYIDEYVDCTESQHILIKKSIDELLDSLDGAFDGQIALELPVNIVLQCVVKHIKLIDEVFNTTDLNAKLLSPQELVPVQMTHIVKWIKNINEYFNSNESSDGYEFIREIDSINYMISQYHQEADSMAYQIGSMDENVDSITYGIKPNNLVGVTNVCGITIATPTNPIVLDPLDPSPTPLPIPGEVTYTYFPNGFEPTIILGGNVYVTNPSTAPPSYNAGTYFVQWLDLALPNNDSCEIFDFSFSLDFLGGSFAILSSNPIGDLSDSVNIFGLTGTITREGEKISSSAYGYKTKGIFGSPKLHKEFSIINNGNQHYIQFLSNQLLYPFLIDDDQSMNTSDMARNIAAATGVHMGYFVIDSPYTDSLSQTGQTGLQALGSIASQVGGQLRWNGAENYSIVYPTATHGTWTVPSSYLITADGIEYENILDLELGVSGTGVLNIPKSNVFDTDTDELPSGGSVEEVIDTLYAIRQKIEVNAPAQYLDLPEDTEEVRAQLLLNPDGADSIASATSNGSFFNAVDLLTINPSIWYNLGSPSIANPQVTIRKVGSAFKKQVVIDWTMFPDIDEVNSGKFVLNIGIVRRNITPAFESEQEAARRELKDLINRLNANIRYIKTYEGSISTFFYGTIPLPGMWASATICGKTVQGIIESVSFSHPGIINVQVAQYLRVNFLDPTIEISATPSNLVF